MGLGINSSTELVALELIDRLLIQLDTRKTPIKGF